jgi:lipopolysaccharide/colanic/teichoic acid biosynthesis glycosyltransferase
MAVQATEPAYDVAADEPSTSRPDGRGIGRVKDIVDPIVAVCAIVLLSPVFLIIAILVRFSSPGPILHRRRVLGGRGAPFDALKFRTMVVDADRILERDPTLRRAFEISHKLKDDPRTTPIGRVLRKYSLDELPQLVNVARGQMWLIGPRMIAAEELVRYGQHAPRLMTVKPGLTGLWQVSGRQNTTYERRVQLDMHYLDTWTLWLDVTILWRTISVVVTGQGGY